MKKKIGLAAVLIALACVLALVALFLYKGVMYQKAQVNQLLGGAVAAAIIGLVLSQIAPRVSNYFPICVAALLAYAAVLGTELMVNQIGYVVAGLDPMSTIQGWIAFVAVTAVGMLISIVAAFLQMAKD